MTTTERAMSGKILGQVLAVGGLMILAGMALPGCDATQHGKYTAEHTSTAKLKMEGLKSATEYKMAEQAYLAGDLPKAQKHIDVSLSLNDRVAKTYVMLGRIKMEMGDVEAASAAFVQAQQMEPKNVDAEYFQGVLAERIDRRDEALSHYLAACELDPSNPQYTIAAAEMMVEAGDLDKADSFLTERASAFDHNAGIRQMQGHILQMKGEQKLAATAFNQAHLLAPDDQSITEDLIRSQMAMGKFAEAEYNLARILTGKENKDRRDLIAMRSTCLVQLDRPVEARSLLLTLTQGQEGAADVDAWINLGEVCYTLHDVNHLRQAATRVMAIAPQRYEGYMLRALQLRHAGDLAGAEKAMQASLNIKKTSDQYVLLGMIQQELSQTGAARESYAAALRTDPKDTNAAKLLSQLDQVAHVEE